MTIHLPEVNSHIPLDKPVLFWDTCALVDIARTAQSDRDIFGFDTFSKYLQVADWIQHGSVTSVTSALVCTEYDNHFDKEVNKSVSLLNKNKETVGKLSEFMCSEEISHNIQAAFDAIDIASVINDTSDKIGNETIVIAEQQEFMDNAHFRTTHSLPPSGGKESYKDSYIWATFIFLAQELHTTESIFFFTSNTKDFVVNADSPKSAQLELDLSNTHKDARLVTKIGEVYGELYKIISDKGTL